MVDLAPWHDGVSVFVTQCAGAVVSVLCAARMSCWRVCSSVAGAPTGVRWEGVPRKFIACMGNHPVPLPSAPRG